MAIAIKKLRKKAIFLPESVLNNRPLCDTMKIKFLYPVKWASGLEPEQEKGTGRTMNTTTGCAKKAAYDGIYNRRVKRVLDFGIAGIALLILWPVYLIIGLLIALEDGFPVLYRMDRGGYRGKTFRISKFRSMVKNADRIGGGTTALHDPRITKVGNVLRKTKLDELPQLGQVFLGKMSLVGPRPELLQYVRQYRGQELDILQVRPGITDYSSLEFINLDEIVGSRNADEMYEKYVLRRKNELRIQYAHTVSFKTDVTILFRTLRAVAGKAFGFLVKKEHR